jgi:NhaP-type Na+/H+ or K+/H+ antiporter
MSYRIVYWFVTLATLFLVYVVLTSGVGSASGITAVVAAGILFPRQWLAEKLSGQSRETEDEGVRYMAVFHLLHAALWFAWCLVLMQVSGTEHPGWKMVPPTIVLLFFPKEWVAEKISRQPRVDPFGRREGNAA